MNITLGTISLVVLILLSGLFSGIEAAFLSLSRIKTKRLVKLKKKNAGIVKDLKDNSHKLIITLLIGNNLVNIAASSIATALALDLYGNPGIAIATGAMTFLILIFGEIIPKSKAIQKAEWVCLRFARPLKYIQTILYPLVLFFDFITRKLMCSGPKNKPLITEEELKSFIEISEETGSIEKDEKEMIHNIFRLNDLEVREIMTPKINMETIDGDKTLKSQMKKILQSHHSRIPVFEETPEKIIGILNIRDTLVNIKENNLNVKISKLSKRPFVVPETKQVDDLLKEMQKKIKHIAIVVDEYGTISGLVTIEDILEEIVGEIYDETDIIEENIIKLDKKTAKVKGETSIEEINKTMKTNITLSNGFDTISGYILKELGKIPEEGEDISLKEFNIKVEKVENNRISQVRLSKR